MWARSMVWAAFAAGALLAGPVQAGEASVGLRQAIREWRCPDKTEAQEAVLLDQMNELGRQFRREAQLLVAENGDRVLNEDGYLVQLIMRAAGEYHAERLLEELVGDPPSC